MIATNVSQQKEKGKQSWKWTDGPQLRDEVYPFVNFVIDPLAALIMLHWFLHELY